MPDEDVKLKPNLKFELRERGLKRPLKKGRLPLSDCGVSAGLDATNDIVVDALNAPARLPLAEPYGEGKFYFCFTDQMSGFMVKGGAVLALNELISQQLAKKSDGYYRIELDPEDEATLLWGNLELWFQLVLPLPKELRRGATWGLTLPFLISFLISSLVHGSILLFLYTRPVKPEAVVALKEVEDRIARMLPEEIEPPKPPPKTPKNKQEPQPAPEKTEAKEERPVREEKLGKLKEQNEQRQFGELKQGVKTERRQGEEWAGPVIPGARQEDAGPQMHGLFVITKKGPGGEYSIPASMAKMGSIPRGEPVQVGVGDLVEALGESAGGKAKRKSTGAGGTEEGEATIGVPIGKITEKKKPEEEQVSQDFQGKWVRIENLGPLAHLNAVCYGKSYGEIVYTGPYKLRCGDNQIIEAWRKE